MPREQQSRRSFIVNGGLAAGVVVMVPAVVRCRAQTPGETTPEVDEPEPDPQAVPATRPADWDPITFNRVRGNAGAIPDTYLDDINGEDGVTHHLGKHLPYVPEIDPHSVPEGFLALMFGDAELGYARHPNNAENDEGEDGHWYNWIRIRKAIDGEAEEVEARFSGWPEIIEGDNGRYAALDDGDIRSDEGRNTVYLVPFPSDVGSGDTIRFWGHCLQHGEYVDFLTLA